MALKSLAVKYRPQGWDEVVEQEETKVILKQQLETDTFKNAYLFCGPAGCGKTTCARIFAHEINKGKGNPIEMDAASHGGVENVREISSQAKSKSLDSEYKVFIIDEAHSISDTGWQAFLKLIEEPPAKSIFIFATTDPQKIPRTIISRVQRYQFTKISQQAIADRLDYILTQEMGDNTTADRDAVEYIAKLAEGGLRDAVTMMDKCLSYSDELTLENVVNCLGTTDYDTMIKLSDAIINAEQKSIVEIIEGIYNSGKDLKQFIKDYIYFLLDIQKYEVGCDFRLLQIPRLPEYEKWMSSKSYENFEILKLLLVNLVKLSNTLRYSVYPKADVEACLLLFEA